MAAVLGSLLAALLFQQVALVKRDYYTGSNSVSNRAPVTTANARSKVCLPGVWVPAGTGRVRFSVLPGTGGGELEVTLRSNGHTVAAGRGKPLPVGPQLADVVIPTTQATRKLTVCVSPLGIRTSFFGVLEAQVDNPAPRLDGRKFASSVATWFLPPGGSRRTVLASIPDMLNRATRLRAAWFGPWTYALVLLLFPVLAYSAVRLLATASETHRHRVPLVFSVALIAFAWAASWSVITPAFDAPDEQDHFAHVQSLAVTGKSPCRSCSKPPYSTELSRAIEGTNVFAYNENGLTRPPWLEGQERDALRHLGRDGPPDDGGGNTTAATHGPYYYLLLVPAYLATKAVGGDVFARLQAMRLVSSLLAGLVVAMVFLTGRELFPRQRLVAVSAALFVGLQPMVGFVGGAVNNDNGVNAAMAVLAFILVRILRRGLTPARGVALATVLVLAPLVKITGYAAYPPALLTLAFVALRQHRLRNLKAWGAGAVTFILLSAVRGQLTPVFTLDGVKGAGGGSPPPPPGSGSPTAPPGTGALTQDPLGLLSYIWQVFLPRLPFMQDYITVAWPFFTIYVVRGFAAFGWYSITFPHWVYSTIVVVGAVVALMAVNVLRLHWQAVKSRGRELLTLGAIVVTVVGSVHTAFFSSRLVLPEQGRYIFTALVPIGLLAGVSCYGLGRRHASQVAAVLLMLTLALAWASQLLGMFSFFA